MLKKLTIVASTTALALGAGAVLATSASAGSTAFNYHGIVIKTPQTVTSYNGGRALVKPSVTKTGDAVKNFAILDVKVVAFVGHGAVATGEGSVALKVGRYGVRTQIKFHTSKSTKSQYVVTPAAPVTVANGGHLKVWHGTKPYTTPFYTVPNGGYFAYSFRTPASGPCHFYLTVLYDDGRRQTLAAATAKSGSHSYVANGTIRSRFQVQGNCTWALAVNYK